MGDSIEVTTPDPVRRDKVANYLCRLAKEMDPDARCFSVPWSDGESSIILTASTPEREEAIRQAMRAVLAREDELVFEVDPEGHIHPRFRTPKEK